MKTKIILTFILILTSCSSSLALSNNDFVQAYAIDHIAGDNVEIRSSQTFQNEDIIFKVTDPHNNTTFISAQTDNDGIAFAYLDSFYTKIAGEYQIETRFFNSEQFLSTNYFNIFPNKMDVDKSTVSPADQIVNINDPGLIEVKIVDRYHNPISNNNLKIISSSYNDNVKEEVVTTNQDGTAKFQIISDSTGLNSYSFYNIDTGELLNNKAKIVFFGTNQFLLNNTFDTNIPFIGNSSASLDNFIFSDITETITPNESINFKITAKDVNSETVSNYSGTVTFSVNESQSNSVTLPNDYTFTFDDQGEHTFSLATSFQETGTYVVTVSDTDNVSITNSQEFNVVSPLSETPVLETPLVINSPISGSSADLIQVITGTAEPNAQIFIYDNNQNIDQITVQNDGQFTYTTSVLNSGLHSFYVATENEGTVLSTSNVVEVNIDTQAPTIQQVLIDPTGELDPQTPLDVKLFSDDTDLKLATMLIDNNIFELTKGNGFYFATINAPVEFGEYKIEFILADDLGNGAENKILSDQTITVGKLEPTPTLDTSPGPISNLSCIEEDSKIIFNWTEPTPSTYPIQNYRVFIGKSPTQLTDAIDTLSNSTTWYVPNLENNTLYYATVLAVNSQGETKATFDEMISCTPQIKIVEPIVVDPPPQEPIIIDDPVDPAIIAGTAGNDDLKAMGKDVSNAGPKINFLIYFSLILGFIFNKTFFKKTSC